MTAVTAAETGHLVLSTLHTPNTVQAVDRVVDSFDGHVQKQVRMLLSTCLRGVVSQESCRHLEGGRISAFEVLLTEGRASRILRDGRLEELASCFDDHQGSFSLNSHLTELLQHGSSQVGKTLVAPGRLF